MNLFLSIVAIVISLAAIILTIVQIVIQREHNFKSIKPIGTINVADYLHEIHVTIGNAGIGPLIIQDIKVYNKSRTANNLIDVLPDDLVKAIIWTDFVAQLKGRAVQAGEDIFLVQAEFPDIDEISEDLIEFRKSLRDCLKDITVEFSYIDIYEKNTYQAKRELDWFGRK